MTRSDLIERLALGNSLSITTAEAKNHEVFGCMAATLVSDNRIEIRGYGSFEIRKYNGHTGVLPNFGLRHQPEYSLRNVIICHLKM